MSDERPAAQPVNQDATTRPSDTTGEQTTVPFVLDPASATVTIGLPQVPGFEIERVLGRGGMGIVYLARQAGLNRLVALKMIRSGVHADASQLQRFQIEAEAVARLAHPGIVQVHQIGTHDGLPFLVLEYVAGGPLSRHLGGAPQPAALCATWMIALADAVQVAHDAGIIHRDLKPSNVLVAGNAANLELKITDFGLAKEVAGEGDSPTVTGAVLGTPSYMAPEQAEGQREIGPAADIYALGAILYELLTGRPPFRSDSPLNTVRQVINAEPAPPRSLNPSVPRDLETICLKCLRKEPGRRYPSARALADDLRRYQRGEPIQARPVGWLERGVRWVRRYPVVTALIAAVFASLLLGVVFSLSYAHQAGEDAKKAKAALLKEGNALYMTEMNLAGFAFRDGELARVRYLLDKWVPGPGEPDRRGLEWALLQRQVRGACRIFDQQVSDNHALGWHPSGERLYFRRGSRLGAWDMTTGNVLFETEVPQLTTTLAIRPDGRQLAAVSSDLRLLLLDGETGAVQVRGPQTSQPVRALKYRPDGREFLSGSADFLVRRHDATTGAVLQTFPKLPVGHHAFVVGVGYIPGSDDIVSLDVYRWLIRWNPATGKPVWKLQTEEGNIAKVLAVHPHRPLAALGYYIGTPTGEELGRIELRELERGQLLTTLVARKPEGGIAHLAFSPDGALLASSGEDRVIRVWEIDRALARDNVLPIAELVGHESTIGTVAWCPDGWRLASICGADRTLRLWSVRTTALERTWVAGDYSQVILHPRGESLLVLGGPRLGVQVPLEGPLQQLPIPDLTERPLGGQWSADGRWLVVRFPRRAEIRDGATLQVRHRLPGPKIRLTDASFTPDGTLLLTQGDDELSVWETSTGRLVRSWKTGTGRGLLAVSPDGALVAVLTQGVAVYRIAPSAAARSTPDAGEKLWERPAGSALELSAVAFLRDGRLLIGCLDGHILVFANPPGPEPVHKLLATDRQIQSLWVIADGRRLLSSDYNGTLTIWDLATMESLRVLQGMPGRDVNITLAVDPSGRWLVRHTREVFSQWDLRPLDEDLIRRQEALALVDYLCPRCLDRTDLLRLVRIHPAITPDVREEALRLAGHYVDDAEVLLWEVFDSACLVHRAPESHAVQLTRAERVVRDLPANPVAWLARGTVRLRLGKLDEATQDFQTAEKLLGERQDNQKRWLVRLQALLAALAKRYPEARALMERADKMQMLDYDPRESSLGMEMRLLIAGK
jgi:WD40 repeat protein